MAITFHYTVDDVTFCVCIYVSTQTLPIIWQPTSPDEKPWDSKESATEWAKKRVAELEQSLPK